jgi:hypothetical protein
MEYQIYMGCARDLILEKIISFFWLKRSNESAFLDGLKSAFESLDICLAVLVICVTLSGKIWYKRRK